MLRFCHLCSPVGCACDCTAFQCHWCFAKTGVVYPFKNKASPSKYSSCRMFRTKRSGLVRRLWRSRLIPDKEGEDGNGRNSEGCRDDLFGNNPEKIPKTEFRPMTLSGSFFGDIGSVCAVESGGGDGGGFGALGVTSDQDAGAMCVPEQGSPRSVQDSECRTVTCCLFKERDHTEAAQGTRDPGSCHFMLRSLGPGDGSSSPEAQEAMPRTVLEQELKTATYSLLKRLKEKALDTLLEAVESRGGMPSDCVMISRTELILGGHVASPQLLVCKVYRWADLQHTVQLKPLCECKSFGAQDSPTVCCNPYHYSRLCGPGKDTFPPTCLSEAALFFHWPFLPLLSKHKLTPRWTRTDPMHKRNKRSSEETNILT